MHSQDTMVLVRTTDVPQSIGAFRPAQIETLEETLWGMVQHEALGVVPCSPRTWQLMGGSPVRPSLVLVGRANGLARLMWARSGGELFYLVVSERTLQDMQWATLGFLPEEQAPGDEPLVAALTEGSVGEVLYAALSRLPCSSSTTTRFVAPPAAAA